MLAAARGGCQLPRPEQLNVTRRTLSHCEGGGTVAAAAAAPLTRAALGDQASQDLGVHPSQLRDWVKKFAEDPQQAFPGHGQMKPEQLEIAQLKREVAKLKAERDILKKAAAYFAKELT